MPFLDDRPYASRLVLGFVKGRPLHVVAALDSETATCIVGNAYEPKSGQWSDGFRTRKTA